MSRAETLSRGKSALINPDELSTLPTIKGRDGALAYVREILGVQVTPTMIRSATESRRLRVSKLSAKNWYSERDLFNWVMSLGRGGHT